MLRFILIFLLFVSWLPADEIRVHLDTQTALMPIYLAKPNTNSKPIEQLREVLAYDLNYNGGTQVAAAIPEVDREIALYGIDQIHSATELLRAKGIYYLVLMAVSGNQLEIRLVSLASGTVKRVTPVELSLDIWKDRARIHQLADLLHEALFQEPGIASTKLLYTIRKPSGDSWISEAWESDWDGENKRQLTHGSGYLVTPTYAPPAAGYGAGSFLYVGYKTGQPKLYLAALRDGKGRRLSKLAGNQLMPALNRQRNQLAFISDVTGAPDLFVQSFDPVAGLIGRPVQIFTSRRGTQASPSYSPNGKQIAFVSDKDGSPRIYTMEIPESGARLEDLHPRLITKINRENVAPAWSPDGKKIAYSAKVQGTRQIWVYDFETNQERQLTDGPSHKENPSWAPNSLHLVFNSETATRSELYILNLNQPQAIRITRGEGQKRFPSWEPRASTLSSS